jgi:hypothetical protein
VARVAYDGEKRIEVEGWKSMSKETGELWWLWVRGRKRVDEISIYTAPHS